MKNKEIDMLENDRVYGDFIKFNDIEIGELYIFEQNNDEICLCLGILEKRKYVRFYSLREKETFLINYSFTESNPYNATIKKYKPI